MMKLWKEELVCATQCFRCCSRLDPADLRILSVYDHRAICMNCKKSEEELPDYPEISKQIAEFCLISAESGEGDPRNYCYHHFYPYRCD